jgi:hypothetical protein
MVLIFQHTSISGTLSKVVDFWQLIEQYQLTPPY